MPMPRTLTQMVRKKVSALLSLVDEIRAFKVVMQMLTSLNSSIRRKPLKQPRANLWSASSTLSRRCSTLVSMSTAQDLQFLTKSMHLSQSRPSKQNPKVFSTKPTRPPLNTSRSKRRKHLSRPRQSRLALSRRPLPLHAPSRNSRRSRAPLWSPSPRRWATRSCGTKR